MSPNTSTVHQVREEEENRILAQRLRDVVEQLNVRSGIVRGEAGLAEGRRKAMLEMQLVEIERDRCGV